MADFKFFLNRQGPKGEPGAKGEKGDNGNTPTFSDGINTPTVYTMQIDMGDGNVFETQNLKYPMRDDGGNYLRYDRTNSTVTLSAPNIADLQRTSGEVTLASVSDIENEDAQDTDAVSMELRNADQLALSNEINRIDRDINTVDDKVDREIQNRQNADTALSGRIDGLDNSKADKTDVYTKTQTDALLNGKANTVHTHTLSQITNAGSLAGKNTVDYNTEVTNKPTIGNGTITITQGGVTKGTFTTNQSGDSTIALDTGGGGGATYTSGPGITINQNNEISANVDNNTIVIEGNSLKANIPVVPTVNDATITITQGGVTKGSFTTNQGTSETIALDAGPDMSEYYTKTQTDSLLDEKIDNDIVQYPLEYIPANAPDYIGYITPSSPSINWYQTYIYGTDYLLTTYGPVGNINTVTTPAELMSYVFNNAIKVNIQDPKNIAFTYTHELQTAGQYSGAVGSVVVGYEENNTFVPVYGTTNTSAYGGSLCFFTINSLINSNNSEYYGFYYNGDAYSNVAIQISGNTVKLSRFNSTSGESGTVTISNDTLAEVNKCNIAYFSLQGKSRTVYENITNYKLCNPIESMYNMTYAEKYAAFNSANDLLYTQVESLSLKYDSNTLGVNANNELTVPTATTSNKGLVQPDGTTITINNGVISAASSTPSDMVTTNTIQTITGQKTFEYGSSTSFSDPTTNSNKYISINPNGNNSSSEITLYGGGPYNNGYRNKILLHCENDTSNYVRYISEGRNYLSEIDFNSNDLVLRPGSSGKLYKQQISDSNKYPILDVSCLDGTTITYDSSTGKISATANPPIATSSTPGIVQPDNSTVIVDGNGVISSVNNSIAKTAPIIPLKYEEQEDGVSVGIGGTLNHTNYTSSADHVYVYNDASSTSIYNNSNGGYFYQSAANMMSKLFYKGYKIRLDNGLNIAWNVAEASSFFMNVAVGYYDNGNFVPVLYALNTNSYGGSMFARPALEFGSDIYDMGRLNTQFNSCVGVSLVGDTLSAFSPTNGRHTYTISGTLLTEFRKCTHAICTVIMESGSNYNFDYSTGKFANPTATFSADLEVRNTVFSEAENLILNTDTTVVPELKLNYDSTYFKVVNDQLTLDIQAIKNAIDALGT